MPDISGFCALGYDPARVDLSHVVTPPYDVIDITYRAALAQRSPYNFVRIDVPEMAGDQRYREAADRLAAWRADGILRRDPTPALYRYHQEFTDGEHHRVVTRKGFVAAVALSPWSAGVIRPHETTFAAPREDRARLLEATRAHLSPVFAMYEDPAGEVEALLDRPRTAPDLEARTDDGTLHRVWRIAEPDTIAQISRRMIDKPAYVLDGHHRYETMVAFGDRERAASPRPAIQRGLMFLVSMTDPGLIVLPTHRVIHGVAGFARDRFLADVQAEFRVERVSNGARDAAKLRQALASASPAPTFAAVFAGDPDAHMLSLVDSEPRSPVASELSVLHDRIAGRILGLLPGTDRAVASIRYVSDTQGALDQIASGQGQLALMVRPATLAQIKQVADAGQVMPQKSTYLFPKLASGLILLPVDREVQTDRERRISELSPVDDEERHRLVVDYNATREAFAHDTCVHEWVAAQAARTPDALAASGAGHALSYRELDEQANRLAHHLRALGVGPEVPVGVCLERTPTLLVALLGVLKAGGAYVPMEPAFPAERQRRMLEDARAPWVITQASLVGKLSPCPARPVVPVVLDTLRLEALPSGPPATGVGPRNLAYVLFTSGSTGRPKGTQVEHRALMNCVHWTRRVMRLEPGQNTCHLAGQSFDVSVLEVWMGLASGACVHLPPEAIRASAIELQAWMLERAIHAAVLATPLGEAVLALDWPRQTPLHTLLVGGARLHAPPRAEIPFTLVNGYGLTETTVAVATAVIPPGDAGGRLPPLGKPLPNTRLYVLDEQMALVGHGVPGELYVGGECVARGYAHRPDLTAERYVPSPFGESPGERLYRTGDIVRWGSDGQLEFIGRRDGQVKLRGFRIELEEISTVLAQHPEVRQAFVRLVPRAGGDGWIVGYAVPREGGVVPEALQAFLAEQLPDYMVPARILVLDALPLTSSGKVDAAALPLPESPAAGASEAPRSPLERELAALWSELLGLEHLGPDDDVYLLGAHSLVMSQAQARIRQRLRVEVPLARLFEAPTVAAQARIIEATQPPARALPLQRVPRTEPLPLSFPQEQLWLLQELHATSRSYHAQALLGIHGELDERVLEACLDEIVRRHEVLRTTFRASAGRPLQSIHPPWKVSVPRVDLRALPAAERAAALQKLQQDEFARTFDVGQLPLLRVLLVRMAEREWALLHVEHHFVHDGWSYSVFVSELLSLYRELSRGRPSPLAELPVQYADFAAWQQQWIHTEEADRQRAYWRRRLAGSPPLLALATDRPRPAVPSMQGASLRVPLGAELYERVLAVARQEGTTPFVPLLAAFTALLHHYTDQDDLPVGSGVANRRWREVEGLLGMFVNMVVLRTDVSGDPTFRQLLARVRATTLEAFEHQDLPFQHVVEALQPERNVGFNPLFQVAFNFHDTHLPAMDPPGLRVELQESLSNGSSKFDLNVVVIPHVGQRRRETGEGLTLVWEYSTDLFDAATMAQMAAHYAHLLAQGVAHPERRISELSPVGDEERHRLVVDYNATREAFAHGTCIHEWVAAQAARTPDALAATGAGQVLSYRELDEQANRLAHHLRALGVGPEVPVGVCLERTPTLLVALLGVLKAGGAYVPMEPAFPAERQRRMLEDARAPWVITQASLVGKLSPCPARPVVLDTLRLEALPSGPPATGVGPRNLAYVLFTSGSTGRPKGIQVEHRTLMNCVHWTRRAMRLEPGQNTCHLAGQSFDASVLEVWTGLATGACVHLPPEAIRASAIELQEWMLERAIHAAFLATPLGEAVLALDWPRPTALHTVLVGGARLHAPPRAEIPFTLVNIYGPTETTVAVTTAVIPPGDAGGRPPPLGKPLPNTRLYVLDEQMALVGHGVPGELYAAGECVTRGYANRPDLTAERYVPSPFGESPGERLYRTGDIVRWGSDGQLEFLGRRDGQVKLRGFRIELEEISTVLGQHPEVRQAFARLVPRAGGDGWIVGYAVPREGGVVPEALQAFLAEQLPDYMVPARILVLGALPLTSSGKVDAAALPLPESPAAGASEEPRSPLEREIAALWSELLGCPVPGVEDNFFALGGNSLMASQMVTRLRSMLAVPVTLRAVFDHARLADLAEHVELLQLSHADAATLSRLLEEVERAPHGVPG